MLCLAFCCFVYTNNHTQLEKILNEKIAGQNHIIKPFTDVVRLSRAGLRSDDRSIASEMKTRIQIINYKYKLDFLLFSKPIAHGSKFAAGDQFEWFEGELLRMACISFNLDSMDVSDVKGVLLSSRVDNTTSQYLNFNQSIASFVECTSTFREGRFS